jgi:hypothetical protein
MLNVQICDAISTKRCLVAQTMDWRFAAKASTKLPLVDYEQRAHDGISSVQQLFMEYPLNG